MIVSKSKENEEDFAKSRLSKSKQVSGDLSDSLQLLIERFITCIKTLDWRYLHNITFLIIANKYQIIVINM